MALDLWVYGDESGNSSSEYSLVSAYIANPRTWDVLRREWDAVITPTGLPELHALDFFTRKLDVRDGFGKNPYASWSDDDAIIFLNDLTSIIRRHRRSIRPLETVVDVKAFKALPQGEKRALTSGRFLFWNGKQRGKWKSDGKPSEPYMVAFQSVVKKALAMCPPTAAVHLVFDSNDWVEGAVSKLVEEIRKLKLWPEHAKLDDIEFGDSFRFPGIQMADLRGYLLNRYVRLGQYHIGPEQAWALSRIGGLTVEYELLDAEHLEKTLAYNLTPEQRAWLRG